MRRPLKHKRRIGPFNQLDILNEEPTIAVLFESSVDEDTVDRLREGMLKNELPLILVRIKEVSKNRVSFVMDGEAITAETMSKIKEVTEDLTGQTVSAVEVRLV